MQSRIRQFISLALTYLFNNIKLVLWSQVVLLNYNAISTQKTFGMHIVGILKAVSSTAINLSGRCHGKGAAIDQSPESPVWSSGK